MPTYHYRAGDVGFDEWFPTPSSAPDSIMRDGVVFKRAFVPNTNLFMKSIHRAVGGENLDILKDVDSKPSPMIMRDGKQSGMNPAQLEAEGIYTRP
jgi:hypothetical protein